MGLLTGVIEQGGAWYTVEGERLQGREAVVSYLRKNPEVLEVVAKKVVQHGSQDAKRDDIESELAAIGGD
jgi:hypothetical protein